MVQPKFESLWMQLRIIAYNGAFAKWQRRKQFVTECNGTQNYFATINKDTRFWCDDGSLVVSLCFIVCLFVSFSCNRTKAAASILPVKNFPTCPLHCGCQPTNQRHAASRQRGFDANLQTSNNHYWRFPCLLGTMQNKMAPCCKLPQYGCSV